MKYITGIHALNLPCSLPTFGDWHRYGIQWKNPTIRDTEKSIFGDYGIEEYSKVPEHSRNILRLLTHIRALLDMLAEGQFGYAQGMRKDFICNDSLDTEVFEKVFQLKKHSTLGSNQSIYGARICHALVTFFKTTRRQLNV